MNRGLVSALLLAAAVQSIVPAATARPFADPRAEKNEAIDNANATEPRDPACFAPRLVSTGGAAPRNPHTLAVRWTGPIRGSAVVKPERKLRS